MNRKCLLILIVTELIFFGSLIIYGYLVFNRLWMIGYEISSLERYIHSGIILLYILGSVGFLGRIVDDIRDDFCGEIYLTSLKSHSVRVLWTIIWINLCSAGEYLVQILFIEKFAASVVLLIITILLVFGSFFNWIKLRKISGLKISD
jgi:hypothetical protein